MEGGQQPDPDPEQGCLQGQLWNSVWTHRLQKVKKYIPAYECKEKQTGLEPRTLSWPLGYQEGNSKRQATNPSQDQDEPVNETVTPSVLLLGQLCLGFNDLGGSPHSHTFCSSPGKGRQHHLPREVHDDHSTLTRH